MNITKDDIEVFIKNYNDQLIDENIIHELSGIYAIDNNNKKYVVIVKLNLSLLFCYLKNEYSSIERKGIISLELHK